MRTKPNDTHPNLKWIAALGALIAGTAALSASAGDERGDGKGNGGNAIVCFKDPRIARAILEQPVHRRTIPNSVFERNQIESIKALDLYEAERTTSGLDDDGSDAAELFEPFPGESQTGYLERVSKRFEKALPHLAWEIRDSVARFSGRTSTHGRGDGTNGVSPVFDVGDLPYAIDRTKCVLATIARQTGKKSDGTAQLDLDARLLNHPVHSDLSRKAIYLHEMIYAWGIESGHEDSYPTRILVSKILQNNLVRGQVLGTILGHRFRVPYGYPLTAEQAFGVRMTSVLERSAAPVGEHLRSADQRDVRGLVDSNESLLRQNRDLGERLESERRLRDDIEADLRGRLSRRKRKEHEGYLKSTLDRIAHFERLIRENRGTIARLDKEGLLAKLGNARVDLDERMTSILAELQEVAGGNCYPGGDPRADTARAAARRGLDYVLGVTFDSVVREYFPNCDDFKIP